MHIWKRVDLVLLVVLATSVPAAHAEWPTESWPQTTPGNSGLNPEVLDKLDTDLREGKYGYVDGMLIIRHGKIAYERTYEHDYDRIYGQAAQTPGPLNAHDPSGPYNYFNPWWHPFYRRGELHTLQSVTKTITSVVIGVAMARHEFPSLDTPILKFFDESKVANVDARKRNMTIRHVMTMTTGLDWDEELPYLDPQNPAIQMERSPDWVQFTIDRPMTHEPGSTFQYSSGATQLLSHIFRSATGKDIEEYAAQQLFAPLGIQRYYWKRSPTGLVDTEGGLYLAPRDLAKIMYLYLKDGVWSGKSIVSSDWVKLSVTPLIADPSKADSGAMYGLQCWLFPYGKERTRFAFGGSGFGGQYPIVVPELDLVIVFTGWTILADELPLNPRIAIDRILDAIL